jgi:putative hemolysin
VREALQETRETGHSRFPLLSKCGELRGVVYGRELTDALLDGDGNKPVETLRHEMLIVPQTLRLDVLLARMKEQHTSICAVVDEYGSLEGVITIEDILEEVVGEIWDEDDLPSGIRLLADGQIVCRGDASLLDLEEYGIRLNGIRGGVMTIGGAIQEALGRDGPPRRHNSPRWRSGTRSLRRRWPDQARRAHNSHRTRDHRRVALASTLCARR